MMLHIQKLGELISFEGTDLGLRSEKGSQRRCRACEFLMRLIAPEIYSEYRLSEKYL